MKTQREHLVVLRHYLIEMRKTDDTNDPKVILTYKSLMDLLEQAINEYDALAGMLQREINSE